MLQAYGYLKDDSVRVQLAQRFQAPRSATSASGGGGGGGGPGAFYNPRASARAGAGAGAYNWEYYRQQARSDPFNGPFSRYNTQDDPPPPKHMG